MLFKGHGLNRRHPVARVGRDDFLLAGDEGDLARVLLGDDPVIDLPGEEPQGQADHPGFMGEHSLQRVMGLAGVGRAQHRAKPPVA